MSFALGVPLAKHYITKFCFSIPFDNLYLFIGQLNLLTFIVINYIFGRTLNSRARLPGPKSWLRQVLVVWPWPISLCPNFLLHKMRALTVPQRDVSTEWINKCKVLNSTEHIHSKCYNNVDYCYDYFYVFRLSYFFFYLHFLHLD